MEGAVGVLNSCLDERMRQGVFFCFCVLARVDRTQPENSSVLAFSTTKRRGTGKGAPASYFYVWGGSAVGARP